MVAAAPKTAFFTIAAWNYLHYARSLAASLAEYHPGIPRFLAVADKGGQGPKPAEFPEFDAAIAFDELGLPDAPAFAFRYDVLELSTAIKPTVFLRLMEQGFERVIYLDPDIVVYGALDEVLSALDGGASTVLTPHALAPNLHAETPNDLNFMRAGVYNLGFMALRNTPDAVATLRWWETRLRTECVADRMADGLFVDQKFVDLWPAYCSDTVILRDPGYNVGYWNLDSRTIGRSGAGYTVNDRPLAFFHFSGIVPGDRTVLSKFQQRWTPSSTPVLQLLFDTYHDRLDSFGRARFSAIPYGFGSFADGTPIPRLARQLFREELEPFNGDPFSQLPDVLNAPAELLPNPGGAVTRLAHALWRRRPDLQAIFDLRDGPGQLRYADWFAWGDEAGRLTSAFLSPVSARLAAVRTNTDMHRGPNRLARAAYRVLMRLRPRLAWLYAPVPPATRRRILDGLQRLAWPSARPPGDER